MLISSLPGANPLPSEHKLGIFVRFLPSGPPFSGISSTKSGFLCAFALRNPYFQAFRAQNRGFCALLPSETLVFGHFEHKIGIFVSETAIFPWFCPLPSTKSAFLCAFAGNQTIGNGNQTIGNGSQAVGNGNQTIGNGNQAVGNG